MEEEEEEEVTVVWDATSCNMLHSYHRLKETHAAMYKADKCREKKQVVLKRR
jgi:hypothetical protein